MGARSPIRTRGFVNPAVVISYVVVVLQGVQLHPVHGAACQCCDVYDGAVSPSLNPQNPAAGL